MIEFESSSLKKLYEHVDVVFAISLELDAKMIGILSNLLKSIERPVANLALGENQVGHSVLPSGTSVVPRRPGARPPLTGLRRRLLWRGRPAVVTAAQKAVPRDRLVVSPRPEWVAGRDRSFRRGPSGCPAANENHPAFRDLPRRGSAVLLEADAAGNNHIGRSTFQRLRR